MAEPILTDPSNGGRPKISDEQYSIWLKEMQPFLELSNSLNRAMEKAGLISHEFSIREKYKLGDWFSRKVDAYRSRPGENVNEAYTRLIDKINDKIRNEKELTDNEVKIMDSFAKLHRTAQPFFVTRTENKELNNDNDNVGKILDTIEGSDYAAVGSEAEKQMVATNPPIQDTQQTGGDSNVPAQPNPVETPVPTVEPPLQPDPQV